MVYIPISVNLDDLVQEFGLDGNQIKLLGTELTNRIGDKYFAAIKQKVNTSLKATRGIYLKNLRIVYFLVLFDFFQIVYLLTMQILSIL